MDGDAEIGGAMVFGGAVAVGKQALKLLQSAVGGGLRGGIAEAFVEKAGER